ncbi:MAG: hypothetical protein PHE79_05235 [Eubacteriales bacterium]|nr:hypothetical protein [Eubacteriales bacterium]
MSNQLYALLNEATQDKPVCRFQYQLKTGKPERQFRKEVEALRKQGVRVVTSHEKKGYWIAKTEEEYIAFRKQQMPRVVSMLETLKAMDRNILGQEVMRDVLL